MLVDAGLASPVMACYGVNVVLPGTSYSARNQKRSAACRDPRHEDHIGRHPASPQELQHSVIYGPTPGHVDAARKMEEAAVTIAPLQTVRPRDIVKVGQHFQSGVHPNTSIADSFSLAITTPVGVIVFTGDFKFDHTPGMAELLRHPADGPITAKQGVLACSSDSTNAEFSRLDAPERAVFPNLDATSQPKVG